jgi:predicted nucleotidyltransferase
MVRPETTPVDEETLDEIVERLRSLPVYKIVLFGSQVWGAPGSDSDLDLLVVFDDVRRLETSEERAELYTMAMSKLRDIERKRPIDLVVHTRPMYDRFLNMDSMMSRKIQKKGKVLYEKDD